MVVGRGAFTEAFPLFGLDLLDYDGLSSKKLTLCGFVCRVASHKAVLFIGTNLRSAYHALQISTSANHQKVGGPTQIAK